MNIGSSVRIQELGFHDFLQAKKMTVWGKILVPHVVPICNVECEHQIENMLFANILHRDFDRNFCFLSIKRLPKIGSKKFLYVEFCQKQAKSKIFREN